MDIVERLRSEAERFRVQHEAGGLSRDQIRRELCIEAADEIEHLRLLAEELERGS